MFSEDFHTLVFAKMFGMYMFLMAIILIAKARYYREMLSRIETTSGSLIFAAAYGLMLGLLLVTIHNTWTWDSDVIVTIFGWVVLIKSILWLSFPECMLRCGKKVYEGPFYYVVLTIIGILGIILMMKGFHPYVDWNPL